MFTTHLFLFIFEHIDKYNEICLLIYHANVKIRRSLSIVEFSPKPKLSMQTLIKLLISARIRRMAEGNVFTGVCLSTGLEGGGEGVPQLGQGYPFLPSLTLPPPPSLPSQYRGTPPSARLFLPHSPPPSPWPGQEYPFHPLPPRAMNLPAINCYNDD